MSAGLAAWVAPWLRLAGQTAESSALPGLSVLIFHRVLPQPDPIFPGEMDAQRFDTLMALLSRSFNVLTVGDAAAKLRAGGLPPRALAITFDDGYADNEAIALPILQRHGLKASFFVATGFLDGGRMWNDTVIEAVRAAKASTLDLSPLGMSPVNISSADQRRAAIELLLSKIKYLSLQDREDWLQRLQVIAGSPGLPNDLMMRSDQVQNLHRAGMEIGGHTVNHPILRVLPDSEARSEIQEGKQTLESLIGAPVDVFAYPNGKPDKDYDQRHRDMVRQLGFKCAVTTAPGVVTADSPNFELPRFTPWDRSPTRWLSRLWVHRIRRQVHATALTNMA
jgi:peptidoglycan/xylan/chitin deacetylase (PgdA/CDA1 family)